jgi:DASH complex subunit DAD4
MLSHSFERDCHTNLMQEKLNEAIMVMNKGLQVGSSSLNAHKIDNIDSLQEVNIQNMNVELVAQMFKNYQSNVLFHLEGMQVSYVCLFLY